jgi:hypothetical protein
VQDFFFALKVEIDRPVGHACLACNVGHFGVEVTVAGKDLYRRAQNCCPFVGYRHAVCR